MNENEWWGKKIKPVWHNPLMGRVVRKVQDIHNPGLPDVDFCFNGVAGKIELKFVDHYHVKSEHAYTFSKYTKKKGEDTGEIQTTPKPSVVSREQYRNLEEWAGAGGNAYVLIGIEKDWWLIAFKDLINEGMTISQLFKASATYGYLNGIQQVVHYLEEKE